MMGQELTPRSKPICSAPSIPQRDKRARDWDFGSVRALLPNMAARFDCAVEPALVMARASRCFFPSAVKIRRLPAGPRSPRVQSFASITRQIESIQFVAEHLAGFELPSPMKITCTRAKSARLVALSCGLLILTGLTAVFGQTQIGPGARPGSSGPYDSSPET